MKIVLALPYERKDEFKQKYGKTLRWNPEDKINAIKGARMTRRNIFPWDDQRK
jgi:hypothetical protein